MEIIYDMPAEEYHALKRFSYSGIKKILTSSQDYWKSSFMNEEREDAKSDSFFKGTAYHAFILEGESVYNKQFIVKPDVDGRTKEGKETLALIKSQYPEAKFIDSDTDRDIKQSLAHKLNIFKEGKPEVSVLWDDEETGVPMKARLDFLTDTKIKDLKTFSNTSGIDIDRLVSKHIVSFGYYIQRALYGDLEPFKNHEFEFVFQQTDGINNCKVINVPSNLLLIQKGRDLVRRGINKFAYNYKKYGTNEWFDECITTVVNDEFFPLYSFD